TGRLRLGGRRDESQADKRKELAPFHCAPRGSKRQYRICIHPLGSTHPDAPLVRRRTLSHNGTHPAVARPPGPRVPEHGISPTSRRRLDPSSGSAVQLLSGRPFAPIWPGISPGRLPPRPGPILFQPAKGLCASGPCVTASTAPGLMCASPDLCP